MTGTWVRWVTLALLVAAGPGHAQQQPPEIFSIKGAQNAIIVPAEWNGDLFLYAHGYSADKRLLAPLKEGLAGVDQLLIPGIAFAPPGSAIAVTTFRSIGWYLKDSIKDIENLRRYFVKKYGKPKHTYIWGHSGGGLVTEAVIEYFPNTYDGAAPMCGPGAGGWRNFNAAFDLRVAYEYVCRDVPDARFVCGVCSDGASRCLTDAHCPAGQTCGATEEPPAPEEGLTRECTEFVLEHPETFSENATAPGGDFVQRVVTPCFGDLSEGVVITPEQAARKDFFLRATQIPESFILTDLFFASIGMAEVFHRRTNGKAPWGNDTVDYAPPLLTADEKTAFNTLAYRSTANGNAVRYMRRFFQPRGRTRAKVVTVHALDDGLVIPENASKYRQAFVAAGNEDQLVQLFSPTGGHCLFIPAWTPALRALKAWVENDTKPTTAAVSAMCNGCLTEMTPGSWGQRIVERKAKGAPLKTLVCDGQPGDCPADASCVVAKHRCK